MALDESDISDPQGMGMLPDESPRSPTTTLQFTLDENGQLVFESTSEDELSIQDRYSFHKTPTGMWFTSIDDDDSISNLVLFALVALLILLAAVIWIAFCMALHRTAKRITAMKRQRRRQVIIANAISRAMADNRFHGNAGAMPNYLASLSPNMTAQVTLAADLELNDLPSYEDALSMRSTPALSPVARETTSVVKPRRENKVIRIAPDRPGSEVVILPPSYESVIQSPSTSTHSQTSENRRNNTRHTVEARPPTRIFTIADPDVLQTDV